MNSQFSAIAVLCCMLFVYETEVKTEVYDASQGAIIMSSRINHGEYDQFLNAAQEITKTGQKVRLVITDNLSGGKTYEALKIGKWMMANDVDVRIIGHCHSSCANYIFLAGKNKELIDALIGYHGSPTETQKRLIGKESDINFVTEEDLLSLQKNGYTSREELVSKRKFVAENEPAFFAETGVDTSIFAQTVNSRERIQHLGCLPEDILYILGGDEFKKYRIKNVSGTIALGYVIAYQKELRYCFAPSIKKELH